jgi:mannose-6-phosphate isomerase
VPDQRVYPYLLDPLLKPLIWGGDALVSHYGKPGDPGVKYGESWECWDENRTLNGPLTRKTVADLRGLLGPELMGPLDSSRIFPVLTKIIDARDSLSVQVHPDDAYARSVEHQPNGKTECWYILSAAPGAHLILGWKRDTTRDEYLQRVADGSLTELLRRVPVNPGDVFYLPAGTLHAIGVGIQLFETQQASDLTYRIFDWNRVDAQGRSRELHVQKAADVLDYRRSDAGAIAPLLYAAGGLSRTALVADPRFTLERIEVTGAGGEIDLEGMPLILWAQHGGIEISGVAHSVRLPAYSTALIPAATGRIMVRSDDKNAQLLTAAIPADARALGRRLVAAGVDAVSVDRFAAQFSTSPP